MATEELKIKDYFKFTMMGENQIHAKGSAVFNCIALKMPLESYSMAISRAIMSMHGNCGFFIDAEKDSGPIPVVEADGIEFEVNTIGFMIDISPGDGMKHVPMSQIEVSLFHPDGRVWTSSKYVMQEYAEPFWAKFGKRNKLDNFINYLTGEYTRDRGISDFDEWTLLVSLSNFEKSIGGMLGKNGTYQALNDLQLRIMKRYD